MQLTRYLKPNLIKLRLETPFEPAPPEGVHPGQWLTNVKESVLEELCELLNRSGKIGSPSKLLTDLIHRERKATTALGDGIAIPHVRTLQAKSFVLGFVRHNPGVPFDAPGGEPVRMFFPMVAPPYDDALYLKVFAHLAWFLKTAEHREKLLAAEDEHQVIRILSARPS